MTKKRPLWEIVLDKIESRVPNVRSSKGAENDIKEFCEMLNSARLSPDEKVAISEKAEKLALTLSPDGDEKWARQRLENLSIAIVALESEE